MEEQNGTRRRVFHSLRRRSHFCANYIRIIFVATSSASASASVRRDGGFFANVCLGQHSQGRRTSLRPNELLSLDTGGETRHQELSPTDTISDLSPSIFHGIVDLNNVIPNYLAGADGAQG